MVVAIDWMTGGLFTMATTVAGWNSPLGYLDYWLFPRIIMKRFWLDVRAKDQRYPIRFRPNGSDSLFPDVTATLDFQMKNIEMPLATNQCAVRSAVHCLVASILPVLVVCWSVCLCYPAQATLIELQTWNCKPRPLIGIGENVFFCFLEKVIFRVLCMKRWMWAPILFEICATSTDHTNWVTDLKLQT